MSKSWGVIADEIPNYVRDLVEAAPGNVEDFVQTGTPRSLTGQAVQAGYRAACRRWARGEGRQDARADNTYAEICPGYLESIGEWPGEEGTSVPFTGGQCAVEYRVQTDNLVTLPDDTTITVASGVFTVPGPITGFGDGPPGAACGVETNNAAGVFGANGFVVTGCPGLAKSITAVGFALLERVDGQPDDCGNPYPDPTPRPVLPDPMPGPEPPPGPPSDEPGDPSPFPSIDIPIDVTINPDGTISIDIDGNQATIDPVGAGDSGGGGPSKPTVGDPQEGEPGGGDNEFGDPPEGEEWIGCFVELLTVPAAYGGIPSTSPQTVWPSPMGNASLYGDGKRYTAIRVLSRWSGLFTEVERLPVSGCRVNVRPGITYRLHPVSLPVTDED